jgi:hypothetical protein
MVPQNGLLVNRHKSVCGTKCSTLVVAQRLPQESRPHDVPSASFHNEYATYGISASLRNSLK